MSAAVVERRRIAAGPLARVTLAVALAAAAVGAVPGRASAAGAEVGHWSMDESSGSVMHDQAGSSLDGAVGAAVVMGPGSYLFPGWTGNVDGSGHLQGKVSATAGAVSVPDPHDVLDPGAGGFSVSLSLLATLTSGRLPAASGASYNIVQKARSDDPGGFWKLELGGSGSEMGKLRWVVSDGRHKVVVTSKRRVDDGGWHVVRAERQGGQIVVTVDGVSASASASSVGSVTPTGKYSGAMTVGKKPGSTDPKDAFAGRLKQLIVAR